MTTIAWDGQRLAVDSRSSTSEMRPSEEELGPRRICLHCERPSWTGSDSTDKLVVMPKVTWRDEKILAAASAGNTSDCERLKRTLKRPNKQIELSDIWGDYALLATTARYRPGPGFLASLVLVTERNLWVVEFEGNIFRSYQEPRDQPYARGSGRDAAMLAMTIMQRNAAEAVWAARAIDPATGGAVRYFDTSTYEKDNTEKKYVETVEPAKTREEAVEYIKRGFVGIPVITFEAAEPQASETPVVPTTIKAKAPRKSAAKKVAARKVPAKKAIRTVKHAKQTAKA